MRARENAPCLGCNDRWYNDGKTCHSECEKYKAYRERKKKDYDEIQTNWMISQYESERLQKIKRKTNLR